MFDRNIYLPRESHSSGPTTVTVINKNPDPIESAKLLKEFQKESLSNVLGNVPLKLNNVDCNLWILKQPENFHQHKVIIKYNINGKVETFTYTVDAMDYENMVITIINEFSKHLSQNIILEELLKEIQKNSCINW